MNRVILPPKRWQEDGPHFDSLRHLGWYARLLVRKHQIPALKQALVLVQRGEAQWKAAAVFTVDERELRDYGKFVAGMPLGITIPQQFTLTRAYEDYQKGFRDHPYHYFIERSAEYHGLNPRALRELWEIDPCVYPNGYENV